VIGRDELRSEIRLAGSFAAESEMFIDFVLQGQATRRYAEAQATYLEDEVEQSAHELERASPESGTEDAFRECRTQLRMLASELSNVRAAIANKESLVSAKGRIRQIGERVAKASSQL
jgi:hypothetical protein